MSEEQSEQSRAKTRERVRRYREKKRIGNDIATPRISPSAVRLALERPIERIHYPIQPPTIMRGVVPKGEKPLVAMDEAAYESARMAMDAAPQFGSQYYAYSNIEGFPGYPYLMLLALRSEYRNMAAAMATELTRKWIKFNSTDTAGESTKKKITEIEQAFTALGIQGIIRKATEHDSLYGTGQILINIKGADAKTPLIIDSRTIKKDSLQGFKNVDPIWTTPLMYNSLTPASPTFYKPDSWWVMGEHWDASRLIVTITREVPDIFKPAFNFSGISLSQLAEPYVNNWLRTRQSVSDLINNFSIVVLKTAMDQVLTGGDDGTDLFARIKLFTATRSNKGVMALDKDREELEQIAVPLGGLHELQSQALEQLCVVSREPATVLTGITPSGFGNVAEGEVRIWYDYIHAQQEAYWREPIDKMFKIVQMSMYGELDENITFEFVPLYEMTEEQMSTIRTNDSVRAGNLIDRGVIDAQEERERLARDPESGYQGIDIEREIEPPDEAELGANLARGTDSALGYDADFVESEHPRDDLGMFTAGNHVVIHRNDFKDQWGKGLEPTPNNEFVVARYMPESRWQTGIKGTSSYEEGINPAHYQHRDNSKTFLGAKRKATQLQKEDENREQEYKIHAGVRAKADKLAEALGNQGIKASVYQAVTGSTYVSLKNVKSSGKGVGGYEFSTQIRLADHPGRHWEPTEWDYHDEDANEYAKKLVTQLKEEGRIKA